MYKALSVVTTLVMVFNVCMFTTGCSQASFDKNMKVVQSEVPAAVALGQSILTLSGDSAATPFLTAVGNAAATDLPILQAAIDAYFANKSSGTKNAIFAVVTKLAGAVNTQVLAANKVLDPKTEADALQKLAAFSVVVNGFQLVLAPFFNSSASARQQFQEVQPFSPREAQEQMAEAYGYTLGQLGL